MRMAMKSPKKKQVVKQNVERQGLGPHLALNLWELMRLTEFPAASCSQPFIPYRIVGEERRGRTLSPLCGCQVCNIQHMGYVFHQPYTKEILTHLVRGTSGFAEAISTWNQL